MRRALAHEVRRPEGAFGACRHGSGFGGEAFIGVAAVIWTSAKAIAEPAEREACGLRDTHDVPASGDGMAEGVQAAFGIERRAVCCGKNDTGSPDSRADDSSARDAHADRTGSLIAGTSDDWSSSAKTCGVCTRVGELAANFLRFVKFWKKFYVDACFAENFARPSAMRDVEQQSSRSVRNVDGRFAGEAQADVVFGQHDFADALPVFGLILSDPQEFGEGEVCQRGIASQLDEALEADGALEFLALGFGALITPDESGSDDFVVFVEQDGAMHLAGKSDGGDGFSGES